MMMIPRKNNFDLFDNMFRDPFFVDDDFVNTKLMRTDIKEKKDCYVLDVDLPGYEKDDIKLSIEDGYLTINAETNSKKDDKEEGKFVRKERYYGKCSRSFYVGDNIKSEDVKASFKNGTLRVTIPKKEEAKELPKSNYIQIDD